MFWYSKKLVFISNLVKNSSNDSKFPLLSRRSLTNIIPQFTYLEKQTVEPPILNIELCQTGSEQNSLKFLGYRLCNCLSPVKTSFQKLFCTVWNLFIKNWSPYLLIFDRNGYILLTKLKYLVLLIRLDQWVNNLLISSCFSYLSILSFKGKFQNIY
jgi:hypothetical protein